MSYIRTFPHIALARHDPIFVVEEVPGAPGTLRVGSIETGLKLVEIVGFPSNLAERAAARLAALTIRPGPGPGPRRYPTVGDQPYALAVAPPISIARSPALSRSVMRNGSTACS
jgi:hypothetical protein